MTAPWPASVERLFWDVDPADVDLDAHADYVMERVMSRGTLEAMRWLRATYSVERWRNSSSVVATGSLRVIAPTGV